MQVHLRALLKNALVARVFRVQLDICVVELLFLTHPHCWESNL